MTADRIEQIEAWLDGELSDAEVIELEVWLSADAARLESFAEASLLHRALREAILAQHSQFLTNEKPSEVSSPGMPIRGSLAGVWGNTVGYFSSGWPVAYLVATVIFGVGLLIGALVHVSDPTQVARRSPPLPTSSSTTHYPPSTIHSPVGRITGMTDCQWADPATEALNGASVPLGRKYALSSGLMEITYDTGAKVILQGPVTYEVESRNGGYVSVGKLTARVEKGSETGNQKSEIRNQKSSLSTTRYPLFTIKTPTATITDLGTEFGVEVDKQGRTASHVFRGLVRVQSLGDGGKPEGDATVLRENESVQVDGSAGDRRIVVVPRGTSASFIRVIPKQTIKTLDVVDVVAGGDGLSGRRCNRWIDPTSGQVADTKPKEPAGVKDYPVGDGEYHRVEAIPFVDGVFIPDGRRGPVQVDSADHTFAEFLQTGNRTFNWLWVRHMIPTDQPWPARLSLGGVDYAAVGHSMLCVDSNKGVTLDLDVIRKANPDFRLLRFRAIAGMIQPQSDAAELTVSDQGTADLWVLVDGKLRFKRRQINRHSGAFSVVVPVEDNERFLTLTSTDGGDGIDGDWIIFGDPRRTLVG